MKKKLFVVCVDRDDDLGRKTGIKGPVIGKEKNLIAAQKLILTDPTESDANTMFAAVKKLQEAEKEFKNVEVVTITGKGKTGLAADKEVNRQLDILTKEYLIDGWILVTDGAEDSQVIPLLQSRGKIISTEKLIIRQAEAVESTYYTIKEALKDPGIARLFLGVPGLILLSYFILGTASFQVMALIAGAYLMLKGFGIEDKIIDYIRIISESLSEQRISFVMYVAAILIPLVGLWMVYIQLNSSEFIDITLDIASALRTLYPFLVFGALLVIAGKATDSIYRKKAYKLGDYIVQAISILCVWAIIDAGTLVFLRQTELTWLPANIMASLIILIFAMRLRKIFDVREKITRIFMGLSVLDEKGNYLGKVIQTNKENQTITIKPNEKNSKRIEKRRNEFTISQGRIIVNA